MLSQYLIICFLIIGAWAGEDDVFNWSDNNFTQELERHENTLVMFYAPRCEDCERLKPEYAMAAELLRGSDPPITLAKVDCMEAGKKTCHKYSVSDYPILKIFSKTEFVGDYNGTKKARGIVKYMQSHVSPASKERKAGYWLMDLPVLKLDEANSKRINMFSINPSKLLLNLTLHTLERRSIKSDTIPDNSGSVQVAAPENFDYIVTNNGKDTLIAFYAPWCTHSQQLMLILDELGDKMSNEEVSIVKFNADSNDVPLQFEVPESFPDLYWLPKDAKNKPVEYTGEHKLDALVQYIAKHATNELRSFDRQGKPTVTN